MGGGHGSQRVCLQALRPLVRHRSLSQGCILVFMVSVFLDSSGNQILSWVDVLFFWKFLLLFFWVTHLGRLCVYPVAVPPCRDDLCGVAFLGEGRVEDRLGPLLSPWALAHAFLVLLPRGAAEEDKLQENWAFRPRPQGRGSSSGSPSWMALCFGAACSLL